MFLSALLATMYLTPAAEPANPFVFQEGDRVVFLGGTLIEREQKYGYWELALTLLNQDKNVSFRNLGWSGDTVWCESRGSFDGPKKGYENTIALLKELKPTVIVICYGHVESFDGKAGVAKFTEGLEKLIDGVSVTKARMVLMTPTPFENVKPLTDVETKNANLKLYATAMQAVAEKRKLGFVDLFSRLGRDTVIAFCGFGGKPYTATENGLHLNSVGYLVTLLDLDIAISLPNDPKLDDQLREAIIAKNELFFHRWRPQNQTYLFGFRKHEQGQNAKEIAEFDPLVEEMEKKIAQLRAAVKPPAPSGRGEPK